MATFSSSISSPAVELQEGDMDKYFQKLQPYTFIQEQGFNPLMRNLQRDMGECNKKRMDKILFAIRKAYNNPY
ncbi:hypothetical protein Golax_025713, partial [Gossypium laxum]|nr:hypothetical protein [Gossypium laxum]